MQIVEELDEEIRFREYQRVFTHLNKTAFPYLVIKGTALAYSVYSQPYLRRRCDTDLWTAEEHVDVISNAFFELGYLLDSTTSGSLIRHQKTFYRQEGNSLFHVFDLHWRLFEREVVGNIFSFDEAWQQRQRLESLPVFIPNSVMNYLICVVHHYAHHINETDETWKEDCRIILSKIPTQISDIKAVAKEKKIISLVNAAQNNPTVVFEEPSHILLEKDRVWLAEILSDIRAHRGIKKSIGYLLQHLFPPKEFVRRKYHPKLPLFFKYFIRIIIGFSKLFASR